MNNEEEKQVESRANNLTKKETFSQNDSRMKSTIKLFENTSLFKALLKVIFLSILVSLATGIYIFADQVMMTRLIPLNPEFSSEKVFGLFNGISLTQQMNMIIEKYNLNIVTNTSSIIRTANSLSAPFVQVGMAIALLIGLGVSISYSRNLGKQNVSGIKNVWTNGFYSAIVILLISSAIIIGIAVFLIPLQAGSTANLIGADIKIDESDRIVLEEFLNRSKNISIEYAKTYVYFSIGFNLLNCMNILLTSLLNSEGKNMMSTIIVIITNLLNIFIDFLLLSYTGLGMTGAAIATNISWAISILLLIVYIGILNKKHETYLDFKSLLHFSIDWKIIWIIVAIGSASFFRNISNSVFILTQQTVYSEITTSITSNDSNYYLGILGAVQPIYNLFFSAIIGVIRGARTVLSYNYAKHNLIKVKQTYWISLGMSFFYAMLFFVLISFALYKEMLWFFYIFPSDHALFADATEILRINMGQLPLFTLGISGMLFFQSTSKSFWSLITSLASGIFVGIPFIFIFKEAALLNNDINLFIYAPLYTIAVSGIIVFSFSTSYIYLIESKNKIYNLNSINNNKIAN